jgi:hypothetical protein
MIVQVEVSGQVLKPNESTTRPVFTTLALDTMSTQQRANEELMSNNENHLPYLGHAASLTRQHGGDSAKAER